jgi:hypothetical protein
MLPCAGGWASQSSAGLLMRVNPGLEGEPFLRQLWFTAAGPTLAPLEMSDTFLGGLCLTFSSLRNFDLIYIIQQTVILFKLLLYTLCGFI